MSLILRPPLVGAIRRQEKTQVLIRVSRHEICPYKVGNSYAVQAIQHQDGTPKISSEKCRIRVVATWRSSLDRLTDEDARQEGFDDLSQLIAWWREKHNEGPMMDVPLHVVCFELDHSERPRFLAKTLGYTHSAAMQIPENEEAIEESRQEYYALEADQTALLEGGRREQERRTTWERHQRLRRVEALSRLSGVDVSSDLRVIDRRLAEAERKLGRRAA